MTSVALEAAQTRLSDLIDQAASGEEVVIERAGKAIARLVPVSASTERKDRVLGTLNGRITIPDDFDAPLPDDVLDAFEGR